MRVRSMPGPNMQGRAARVTTSSSRSACGALESTSGIRTISPTKITTKTTRMCQPARVITTSPARQNQRNGGTTHEIRYRLLRLAADNEVDVSPNDQVPG